MTTDKLAAAVLLLCLLPMLARALGPALVINDVEIPRSKIQAQVDRLINERGMNSGGITQPATYQQMQSEVVEQLIVQKLLSQEARRREILINDDQVDQQLDVIKQDFDTPQAFLFQIKAGGFSERSYREDIRQRLAVQQMINQDLTPEVIVSKDEIEAFYMENLAQMSIPEQRRARHILIPPGDSAATKKSAEAQILVIQEQLQDDKRFEDLAREYSRDSSAAAGGDLGFFGRGQMVPAFERAVFALKPR